LIHTPTVKQNDVFLRPLLQSGDGYRDSIAQADRLPEPQVLLLGWRYKHESGSFLRFTSAGAELFA